MDFSSEICESFTMSETKFCTKCGANISSDFRFCPKCGSATGNDGSGSSRFQTKFLFYLIPLCAAAYGLQSFIHYTREDKRPTEVFQEKEAPASQTGFSHASRATVTPIKDEELDNLRTELEKSPQDLDKLRALVARIATLMRQSPEASQVLALEAVDTLGSILKQTPEDPEALIMMADVSFDQRAFEKAAGFYERYLKVSPEDLGARARYGSTLTFLGKLDQSVTELTTILEKDPSNFPANAYLSITYAEKGDEVKALEIGQKALSLAPNDEARARFGSFVDSIKEEKKDPGVPDNAIVAAIRRNPIAGPKFVEFSESEDKTVLSLIFRDFPMQAMPPFAKEKFFQGVRDAAKGTGYKAVKFMEFGTGKEMERLDLK